MNWLGNFTYLSYTHVEQDNLGKCVSPDNTNDITITSLKILVWGVGDMNMHSWENMAEGQGDRNSPSWEFQLKDELTVMTRHECTEKCD